jgi:hypothetical protein
MTTISIVSHNIRNASSLARRTLGLKLEESREVLRSGDGDGLWRVHLADGTVIECTLIRHAVTKVENIAA